MDLMKQDFNVLEYYYGGRWFREENWQRGCYPSSLTLPDFHDFFDSIITCGKVGTVEHSESGLIHPTHTPRSELPPNLLLLNIFQALEMAWEQRELYQDPRAGKWVLSRTGFTSFNLVKVAVGWKKWIRFLTLFPLLIQTGAGCQNPGCDAVNKSLWRTQACGWEMRHLKDDWV